MHDWSLPGMPVGRTDEPQEPLAGHPTTSPGPMHSRAVYPGTFDPVTYGHIDLIKRARKIFDEVVVAVAHNPAKGPLFTVDERMALLRQATRSLRGVVVDQFDSLVVDYVRGKGARVMIRGLRMLSDFEYEFQMALTNRKLADEVETIFMMPSEAYSYISARLIKEAAQLGANLSAFVPPFVAEAMRRKLRVDRSGRGRERARSQGSEGTHGASRVH